MIFTIAVICPLESSSNAFSLVATMIFRFFFSMIDLYRSLLLDEAGSKTILITGELELRNPKTRKNMIGNRKINITAEGILNI